MLPDQNCLRTPHVSGAHPAPPGRVCLTLLRYTEATSTNMAGFEQPTENHLENSSKNLPTSSLYVNLGSKQWLPCSIPVASDCVPKITAVMHFLCGTAYSERAVSGLDYLIAKKLSLDLGPLHGDEFSESAHP